MYTFNKVIIESNTEDVKVSEGDSLIVIHGSYFFKNNELHIVATDDVEVILPVNHYEEINITTDSGDCVVEMEKTTVSKLVFSSDGGDLTNNSNCEEIMFDSYGGVYKGGKYNSTRSSGRTTITPKPLNELNSNSHGSDERYK